MKFPGVRRADDFRVLAENVKYDGKVVKVAAERVLFPNGVETVHERLQLPRAVAVVPLLEQNAGRPEVVLVEQLRSSVRGYIHEIPAGILEEGEDPMVCAARELEEETGYRATSVRHLATLLPIPGTSPHLMDFYLAEGLSQGTQQLEEAEVLSVKHIPLVDLLSDLLEKPASEDRSGARIVVDAKTHLGILHVAALRSREGKS